MFFATDWALKRVLKFILKRNLGRYLKTELDLEQLDVQLGTGTLELRNLLLNCESVNLHLATHGWLVKAGYCGCIRASIPLSTLSTIGSRCSVEITELLITVTPCSDVNAAQPDPGLANLDPEPPPSLSPEDVGIGQFGVVEGIKRIAGGIEAMLQQMCVTVKELTIRVEVPAKTTGDPGTVLVLRTDSVSYSDNSPTPSLAVALGASSHVELKKTLELEGFLLEIGALPLSNPVTDKSKTAAGVMLASGLGPSDSIMDAEEALEVLVCNLDAKGITASLVLTLTWKDAQHMQPHIAAQVTLQAIKVQLFPHQLKALLLAIHSIHCSRAAQRTAAEAAAAAAAPCSPDAASMAAAAAHTDAWGRKSFVEELFLPDCGSLVADTLQWPAGAPPDPTFSLMHSGAPLDPTLAQSQDEFLDARSIMQSVTSSMFHSTNNLLGYMYNTVSSIAGTGGPPGHLVSSHLSTTSSQGPVAPDWAVKVTGSEVCLALCYGSAAMPGVASFFTQKLCVTCTELRLHLEVVEGRSTAHLKLYQLEVAEHLAPSSRSSRMRAVNYAIVPTIVPRASPASAASHPRAWHSTSSRRMLHGSDRNSLTSRTELWPVLSCASQPSKPRNEGTRASLSIKLTSDPASKGPPPTHSSLSADINLLPVTFWVNPDCVTRLVGFFTPAVKFTERVPAASVAAAAAAAAGAGAGNGRGAARPPRPMGPMRHARMCEELFDSIVDDLQEVVYDTGHNAHFRKPGTSTHINIKLFVPHMCLVLALPAVPQSNAASFEGHDAAQGAFSMPSFPGATLTGTAGANAQRYLVLDMSALHEGAGAVSSSMRPSGSGGPASTQRLIPLLKAARIPGSSAGGSLRDVGSMELCAAQARVYLVESCGMVPTAEHLQGVCILEMRSSVPSSANVRADCGPDAVPPGAALFAEVSWEPSNHPGVGILDFVWEQVQVHGKDRWTEPEAHRWEERSHFNSLGLQERCSKSSVFFIHGRAPQVVAHASRADLLALWKVACSVLYASALAQQTPAPNTIPEQVSFLFQCRLQFNLQKAPAGAPGSGEGSSYPSGVISPVLSGSQSDLTAFSLSAEDVTWFQVANLGCMLGAGVLFASVQGLALTGSSAEGCLVYCPSTSSAPGASPCMELLQVTKSSGTDISAMLASVLVRGTTISTDYGRPTFDWAMELAAFFDFSISEVAPPPPVAESTMTHWSLNLEDMALRFEPYSTPYTTPAGPNACGNVAAVMLLEGLHWGCTPGNTQQDVVLNSLGVHVAAMARRGPGWDVRHGREVHMAALQAANYYCVMQETQLRVTISPEALCGKHEQPMHQLWELEVCNQHMFGSLTQDSTALLLQLMAQWMSTLLPPPPPHSARSECGSASHASLSATPSFTTPAPILTRTTSFNSSNPSPHFVSCSLNHSPCGSFTSSSLHVLDGVQEDAFRPATGAGKAQEPGSPVFMEARWYDGGGTDEDGAGPGPMIVNHFDMASESTLDDTEYVEDDMTEFNEQGMWYDDSKEDMREDYVKEPTGEADLPAAPWQEAPTTSCPISRVALRNLSMLWVLHTPTGGPSSGAHEGRVEVEMDGVGVVVERFALGEQLSQRCCVVVTRMEVRDCCAHHNSPKSWVRVLAYRQHASRPRDSRTPMLAVLLDTVYPNAMQDPQLQEYRLSIALLPLRLRLDQNVVAFLQSFGQAVQTSLSPLAGPAPPVEPDPEAAMYFQKVEVKGFSVLVDYRPRRVDINALREGCFLELINLVPWGGVDLSMKPLRLAGVQGWEALQAAVAVEWLEHIARTQAHKFVTGMAPISSICRMGSAVSSLVTLPAQLRSSSGAAAAAASATTAGTRGSPGTGADSRFARQLRRSTSVFVRTLVFEALGLGAYVAGGAQLVLANAAGQGTVANLAQEQPATVAEGLRQAADKLSAGFETAANVLVLKPIKSVKHGEGLKAAVVRALKAAPAAAAAPASAAAAAVRCTLLGVRNSMDLERQGNK